MDVLIPAGVGVIVVVGIAVLWRVFAPREPRQPSITEPATAPEDRITMYDRVGPDTIRVAVDQFYHRVLGDPRLSHYFAGVNMSRLHRHQALFIGQILGGPVHFQMHQLEAIHRRLRIDRDTYWAAAFHLIAVMSSVGASDDVRLHLFGALLDLEGRIVANPARAAV